MTNTRASDRPSRGVLVSDGGGTYLDIRDTQLLSETSAGLTGGLLGIALGGTGAMMSSMVRRDRNPNAKAFGVVEAALLLVGGAVGALGSLLSARTHNKWAKQVLDQQAAREQAQESAVR